MRLLRLIVALIIGILLLVSLLVSLGVVKIASSTAQSHTQSGDGTDRATQTSIGLDRFALGSARSASGTLHGLVGR